MGDEFELATQNETATIKVVNLGGKNVFCYNNGTRVYISTVLDSALFKGQLQVIDDDKISMVYLNPEGHNSCGSNWEAYNGDDNIITHNEDEKKLLSANNFTISTTITVTSKNVTHSPNFKRNRSVPETLIENCAFHTGGSTFHSAPNQPNGVNLADGRSFTLLDFDRTYGLKR